MGAEQFYILLHLHRGRFEKQLKVALAKVWAGWTQPATELHTFRADHKNRTKAGNRFLKLNNVSIAAVREDLTADYQALADRHLEEVVQILEEYGAADLEIAHQLKQYEADRQATGRQTVETVELQDSPLEEAAANLQGEPVLTTPAPPNGEPAMKGTSEPAPLPVLETMPPPAPSPTTTTVPPQPEPCPATTTELPPQPDLTTEPMTVPLAEPTPEPELPRPDVSEPLHTDDTTQSLETETVALDLPPVTTPTPDPTPPESSILHIFDDA